MIPDIYSLFNIYIMRTVTNLYLNRLQNANHFTFMKEFLTLLLNAEFEAQKLKDGINELKTCFQEEDTYFRLSQEADQTKQIEEADLMRDKNYNWLKSLVTLWAKTPYEAAASAKKIQKVLNTYKLDTKVNYRAETGIINNIVSDLTKEDMLKALEDIGGTLFFNQMLINNRTLEGLMRERTTESSTVPKGALADARAKCDEVYAKLVVMLEGGSALADDSAVYDQFIDAWNANIENYRTLLKRMATLHAKADEGTEPTPSEEPTPGEEPIEPAE